jgi:hypothetical protein
MENSVGLFTVYKSLNLGIQQCFFCQLIALPASQFAGQTSPFLEYEYRHQPCVNIHLRCDPTHIIYTFFMEYFSCFIDQVSRSKVTLEPSIITDEARKTHKDNVDNSVTV